MRTTPCITALLSAAALAACDTPEPDPPGPIAVSTSFDVTATLTFQGEPPTFVTYPETLSFVLRLDDQPDGITVAAFVANEDGWDNDLLTRTEFSLDLQEPLQLPIEFGDYDPYGELPYIELSFLAVDLHDEDKDGNADSVTGSGSGVLRYVLGDVGYDGEFTYQLRGDRDATPPRLFVAGNATGLHVLDGLEITASELLQTGSTARASYDDTAIDLAPIDLPGGGDVRSFRSSGVLPFNTELRIEIEPLPRDLAGLAAESVPTTVRTMPDPGMFPEDGFEADPVATVGSASIVTGVGTLPAIAGARSLLVEPGDGLTMRIPVAASDTHLRFQARLLYETDSGCETQEIRVAAPGQAGLQKIDIPSRFDDPKEDTGDSTWLTAGPVTSVEMPLTASVAGEAVFDIAWEPPLAPPCPTIAILIDDLRAE